MRRGRLGLCLQLEVDGPGLAVDAYHVAQGAALLGRRVEFGIGGAARQVKADLLRGRRLWLPRPETGPMSSADLLMAMPVREPRSPLALKPEAK